MSNSSIFYRRYFVECMGGEAEHREPALISQH